VLHIGGDATGAGLIGALYTTARSSKTIEFLPGHLAVSLRRDPHRVTGVVVLDPARRPFLIKAQDVVLATGGLGQLYCHTTNPPSACGDGLAMALEARARTAGLEFVQFHPTALAGRGDPLPLITEALRGAGATLVDDRGERFMVGIHPAAELAPRDIVARAIWRQMRSGYRVYLDARSVFSEDDTGFPTVRSLWEQHGIDVADELIPVVPAAHYHMGGVAVDLEGRSSIPHLWACGEVACSGVHGANRLASNSLLEAVVFGRRLGAALALRSGQNRSFDCGTDYDSDGVTAVTNDAVWQRLRRLMWESVGIVRHGRGLQAALSELIGLVRKTAPEHVQLRGRLRLARAIAVGAFLRRENCGAHRRADSIRREAKGMAKSGSTPRSTELSSERGGANSRKVPTVPWLVGSKRSLERSTGGALGKSG